LSVREMASPDAVIAWGNIERRAADLHAAGAGGSTGQLQVQAVADILTGRAVPGQDACSDTHPHPAAHPRPGACRSPQAGAEAGACSETHPDPAADAGPGARPGTQPRAGRGGGRAGWAVNPVLVIPWDPALGRASGLAELPGYGPLDEQDTADLLAAAGASPATRWCVTVTSPADGTAVAHGCITGRRTLADFTQPGTARAVVTRL